MVALIQAVIILMSAISIIVMMLSLRYRPSKKNQLSETAITLMSALKTVSSLNIDDRIDIDDAFKAMKTEAINDANEMGLVDYDLHQLDRFRSKATVVRFNNSELSLLNKSAL
jgi:hypothetical protein